ncbi:restriction endonuclease subunit S [Proteiniphilum propionicum]|uniref:restriction endonuclease subunit S n=1 Tax=Proteiniphilum propionicum TaxID=2829812 RepID=UPI002112D530|nr:restriction endonuclease subunit S [Proteiniphilum propionicum]ULB35992.1 restriction endonuclease subunit S [Proteiniphilum propionicum]
MKREGYTNREGYTFYPTDHCGVIRLKNTSISLYYLAMELNEIGKRNKFSRTFRASTGRIKQLRIEIPNEATRVDFDKYVVNINNEIKKLKEELLKTELKINEVIRGNL